MEQSGSARWVTVTYFPVTDPAGQLQAIGVMHRDVSSEMAQQASIEVAQQEIASQRSLIASLEAAQRQIQEQASIIRELSSPISQIWEGVLVAPVVGSLDANRATMITENLLEAIVQYQADIVILDITGVPLVDTQVASYLVTTTSACKLLGSRVVLVGIGGEIAQTIVHLGVDLTGIITLSDLRAGILWAFERLGLQVTRQLAPVAHQQRATSARGVAKKG
ncbi:MAG: STAS domain-containing protein [Chloroflexaceae bacterium]|nr:STAS domain-containing protein [Chloroflexaceae bacterium]